MTRRVEITGVQTMTSASGDKRLAIRAHADPRWRSGRFECAVDIEMSINDNAITRDTYHLGRELDVTVVPVRR